MAQTIRPEETRDEPIDDYRVEPVVGQAAQPPAHYVFGALNALLLIVLAAASFALFWVVATLLGFV